jgi:GNAT superfamily N-acetyltransferase
MPGETRNPEQNQGASNVRPPEHLGPHHDLARFCNGKHPSLDDWLRDTARSSEGFSARTYVACPDDDPTRVVGYYTISTASEERIALPTAKLRRGMPVRVPLLLIGRLAVDQTFQGIGLGTSLPLYALRRCLSVADVAGVRGVIAHAIDDDAVKFYLRNGFVHCPLGERVMLLTVENLRALFDPDSTLS